MLVVALARATAVLCEDFVSVAWPQAVRDARTVATSSSLSDLKGVAGRRSSGCRLTEVGS